MIDIFTVENGNVVLNTNCLLIPELKAVRKKYKKYMQAFSYIHFMSDPSSVYNEYEHEVKQDLIHKEYPGDYKITDLEITAAIDRANDFYASNTIIRYYMSVKKAVDKMGNYLATVILDDSKEGGNIQHVQRAVKECSTVITQFKNIEKLRDEEVLKARGKTRVAYDQEN